MLSDREQLRYSFITAWEKFKRQQPLSLLEKNIVAVLQQHPDYVSTIENKNDTLTETFRTDNNPFLHMGLHLSLREQLTTQRPKGINTIYQQLYEKHQDHHHVEHIMMEAMAQVLWEAQHRGQWPDETRYLELLKINSEQK